MRVLVFLAVLLLLTEASLANGQCAPLTLAKRMGRNECWVQYALKKGTVEPHSEGAYYLCVPRSLYLLWLRDKGSNYFCASQQERPLKKARRTLLWKVRGTLGEEKKSWRVQKIKKLTPQIHTSFERFVFGNLKKIEILREKIRAAIPPEKDRYGLLRSLILNEKSNDSAPDFLRNLGFVHIATASGIHLYALALWIEKIVYFFSKTLHVPTAWALRLARGPSLATGLVIWILSGCRIGLLRPAFVILLKKISQYLGFRWKRFSALGLALVLELMISFSLLIFSGTESFFQSGRWTYALAIGGGMMGYHALKNSHLGMAVGSWALIAWFEAYSTGIIAFGTPFFSLLSLPVICLFLYPLLLFSILFLSLGFDQTFKTWVLLGSQAFDYFMSVLIRVSFFPGNVWVVHKSELILASLMTLFFGLLWILNSWNLSWGRLGRFLKFKFFLKKLPVLVLFVSFFLMIPIFYLTKSYPLDINSPKHTAPQAEKITQLDVGQGDAALVQYLDKKGNSRAGLIDTGSAFSLKDAQWLRLLSKEQLTSLDWVGLTHLDEDHSGALFRLSRLIPIGTVLTSSAEIQSKKGAYFQKNLLARKIRFKDWTSQGFPFPVLSTQDDPHSKKANARMSTVLIPIRGGGFYLNAGDATQEKEKQVAIWARPWVTQGLPRILKISHHGSKTSTSAFLLKTIQPTQSWISVGLGNSYGHPHPLVMTRLRDLRTPILRTDQLGSIHVVAKQPLLRK